MPQFRLSSEPDASDVDQQFIRDAIDEFNMALVNDRNYSPLSIFVRDDAEKILGGILGHLWGGWLHVTYLWVTAELRGQGFGSRLLRAAEDEARAKGCRCVFLETFSFQAPDFYRRFGFQRVGQITDYPPGHSHFVLWKPL